MAITINPATYEISIPQSDLTLISGTLYKADTNTIRLELKTIEASEFGIVLPDTNIHNTTVELFGVIYARTIEIIAPYSLTFTPDSQWSVRLDGSNNNYGDVGAGILNQNQVQVIPTNSAGLQDLSTLLAAAYNGQVVINTITGQAGTSTPIGTYFLPSNNMADAEVIADKNGIVDFVVGSNLTLNENLNDGNPHRFTGTSPFITVTANPGADLTGVSFQNLTIQGELDGVNVLRECAIGAVTNTSGYIEKCSFKSTASFNGDILIMESYSNVEGGGYPTMTGSAGNTMEIRDWHGSIGIAGVVDSSHTVEGEGGRCVIESSCTGGNIHVRGSWFEIVDNSGAGCTVLDERGSGQATLDPQEVANAVWDEPTAGHTTAGTTGKALIDAGAAGNPWDSPLSGSNTEGTFGYLLQTTYLGFFNEILSKIANTALTTINRISGTQSNQN